MYNSSSFSNFKMLELQGQKVSIRLDHKLIKFSMILTFLSEIDLSIGVDMNLISVVHLTYFSYDLEDYVSIECDLI